MKTYRVTLECTVRAKSDVRALDLLDKAVCAAMKVAVGGVSTSAEEASDG